MNFRAPPISRNGTEDEGHSLILIMSLTAVGVALSYFGFLSPQFFWGSANVTPMVGWLFLALAAGALASYTFNRVPQWTWCLLRLTAAGASVGLAIAEVLQGRPLSAVVCLWLVLVALERCIPAFRALPNADVGLLFCVLLSIYGTAERMPTLAIAGLAASGLLTWHRRRPYPVLVTLAGLELLLAAALALFQPSLSITALTAATSLGLLTYRFFGSAHGTMTSRYFRSMLLVGSFPLLILGSFLTYTGQGQALNQSLRHMAYTAAQSAQVLDAEVWAAVDLVRELANRPGLAEMLESEDVQGMEALLDSASRYHVSLAYVGLVRPDGSVIAQKRPDGSLSAEILQKLPEHRYELFIAGQPVGPEPYLDSQGRGFLVAAVPVPSGRQQAAVVGAVSMDRMDVRFHQVAGPAGFHHMLVDLSRRLVISDHDTRQKLIPMDTQGWQEDLASALLKDNTALVERGGMSFYASYASIQSWGWGVIVYQDIHSVLGQTQWISWANLFALLAVLGVTMSLSLVSSRELTMPLLNLSWTARRIKQDFGREAAQGVAQEAMESELSEIASTLNVLVDRIVRADEAVHEHSRRLEEQIRHSQALQEANLRLSTLLSLAQDALQLEIDPLLHAVVERLAYTCSAYVTLWWPEGAKLRRAAVFSPDGRPPAEECPSAHVLAAVSARAASSGQARGSGSGQVLFIMAVPVKVEGETVAVLELRREGPAFAFEEQQTVEAAASVTSMALRLNKLYQSAQHQASLYKHLGQMAGQALAALDPRSNLDSTLTGLMALAQASSGLAIYLDADGQLLTADRGLACLMSPRTLLNRLAPHLADANVVHSNSFRGELPILGVDAWLALAIRNEGAVRGVVVLGFSPSRSLENEERDALEVAIQTASLALQRSELYLAAMRQRDLATTIINTVPMAILLANVWEKRILVANGAAASAGLEDPSVLEEAGFWQLAVRTAQWRLPYRAKEVLWIRDGSPTYWDLSIWPMAEASGAVLIAAHDVTDAISSRERIQILARAVERDRTYLASLLNSMTEGLLIVAQDGTVSFANPRAELLLGAGQLNGRSLQELADRLEEAQAIGPQAKAFLLDMGRSIDRMEIDLNFAQRRGLACQWFEISGAENEQVRGLLLRDVTVQRELDRFRDNLISVISHELRTPITSILGFSELATVREFRLEELKRMLKIIHREASHLADIVGEFLEAGRLTAQGFKPNLAPVDLGRMLEEAVDLFRHRASHHTFRLRLPEPIPALQADEGGIRLVLENLLGNAVKYTPQPGQITVSASLTETEVVISVADTGLGILPEEKEKIFERFYRAKAHSRGGIRGTGLGLTIARDIVVGHGGRIWVESEPGKGSTFYFTLPLNPEPQTE